MHENNQNLCFATKMRRSQDKLIRAMQEIGRYDMLLHKCKDHGETSACLSLHQQANVAKRKFDEYRESRECGDSQ